MSKLASLKSVRTRGELADLLNYSRSALAYAVYKVPEEQRYKEFKVAKRSGGERIIHAPCPELKGLQKRLSNYLYDCHREIWPPLEFPRHSYSHGFQKNRGLSIFSNAWKHRNKRFVFNVDLKDYFPSFNFGRVRGYFQKNRSFELHQDIATLIAQIVCYDNSLPQGAPTSPIVSELITSILDQRLGRLSKKHHCTYSRYADDITFSTNQAGFPEPIADFSPQADGAWKAGSELVGLVERSGFEINPNKTRMQLATSRQSATGLVVNRKVNIPKQYYDDVRAMSNSLFKTGVCHHPDTKEAASLAVLKGKLEFVLAAKTYPKGLVSFSDLELASKAPGGTPVPSHYKLYRRFLAYEKFHANARPLVICEGKTDNTYIRCAIASLNSKFPLLQPTTDAEGSVRQALSFFKHSDKHAKLLSISGGAGELHKFVGKYGSLLKDFHSGGEQQPVIVIVDNDNAAKPMWSVIKEKMGSEDKVDGSANFYHVKRNLFVVPIPIKSGKFASIEDLFDKKTLATVNKGKKFNPHLKSHQTTNQYGKEIFAKWVIEANAENIDFSGFEPLLGRLEEVLKVELQGS
ncbi:retron Ec67 family RNA-directed DNA polymerase/endonuclease [Nioella sediminis]|uniref:retron Ec67 family RNA-directed DNA polymerase/endonuclease n=1 Tax=Nioella sediminis TaxID=1912092 RepID=UPI0008FCF765|nr:retron Ec67 family RNA-directed DNA polymerase/endonuclease [Nioella sediminis]TBX28734.1 hypothetical protein TK43_03965 [Roseovarius sp. JS7-11]